MDISEVEITLHTPRPHPDGPKSWRLKAFAQVILDDCFIIHEVKIIEGMDGEPFLQFPSRAVQDHCPRCHERNGLRDAFCRRCGLAQEPDRGVRRPDGTTKLFADVAHPLTNECRDRFRDAVLDAYREALHDATGSTGEEEARGAGPLSARLQAGRVA